VKRTNGKPRGQTTLKRKEEKIHGGKKGGDSRLSWSSRRGWLDLNFNLKVLNVGGTLGN